MNDVEDGNLPRVLLSLPVFAYQKGLGTMRELQYNQLSIKLKDDVSEEDENRLT